MDWMFGDREEGAKDGSQITGKNTGKDESSIQRGGY